MRVPFFCDRHDTWPSPGCHGVPVEVPIAAPVCRRGRVVVVAGVINVWKHWACLGYALASRDDTPLGLHANRWRLPLKPAMLAALAAGCRSGRLDLQPPDPCPAGRGSCRRASLRCSKSVSGLDVAYTTEWPGMGRGELGRQRRPFR